MIVCGAVLLAGWIVSMVAWGQIRHSGGTLHGLPWAVVGTFLAPAFLCCGVPAMWGLAMPGVRVEDGPGGSAVRMPFLSVEEKDGNTRVKMPFLDVTTKDTGDRADMVSGGPHGMTDFQKRMVVTDIEVLWVDAVTTLGIDPQPGDHEELLASVDRGTLQSLSPEERAKRQQADELGLPFAGLGSRLRDLRLFAVALGAEGDSARVVRSDGTLTVSFPVRKEGDDWAFALGVVERADRAPEDGDSGGRIHRPLVLGGPENMTEAQRMELADDIADAARAHGIKSLPDPRWRVVYVALTREGDRARVVFTNGARTVALLFVRKEWIWSVDADEPEEVVDRPPEAGDRDGWLTK
jgi:hypothetical protein